MSNTSRVLGFVLAFTVGVAFTINPMSPATRLVNATTARTITMEVPQYFNPFDATKVAEVAAKRAAEMTKDENTKIVDNNLLIRTVQFLNKVKVDKLDVHINDGKIIKAIVNIDASVINNCIQKTPVTENVTPVAVEGLIADGNQRAFVMTYWHSRDAIYKAVQDKKTRAQVLEKLVAHYNQYKGVVINNTGLTANSMKLYFKTLLNDGQKFLIAEDMLKIISFIEAVEKKDGVSYGSVAAKKSIASLLGNAKKNVETVNATLVIPTPSPTPNPNATATPAPRNGIVQTTAYPNGYKFDPPVTVTTMRFYGPQVKFLPGENIDNNVWTKAYESYLGIKLKSKFTVTDFTQYDLKVTTSIATDTLPDIMPIYTTLFFRVADSGRAKDLKPYYDRYLDTELKDMMQKENGGIAFNTCYRNGILAAIAAPTQSSPNMMWIRQDWLSKYGLSWPKNINEALKIMKTFSKKNAGAPMAPETFAFPLMAYSMQSGFSNAFGAYSNIWISDGKDGLMRSDISTKWKPVLKTMQDMYDQGYIDPSFSLSNSSTIAYQMTQQQFGFDFDPSYAPDGTLNNSVKTNKKAVWKSGIIKDTNGNPALMQVNSRINGFTCVNKKSQYPEALMFIANLYGDLMNGAGTKYQKYHDIKGSDGVTYNTFFYPLVGMSFPYLDDSAMIDDAVKAKDNSKLTGAQLGILDSMKSWTDKKSVNGWGIWAIYNPLGSIKTQREIITNKLTLPDKGWGPETPTWLNKGPDLMGNNMQYFVRIIRGDYTVDGGFSSWTSYFNNNGGKTATSEINTWWKLEGKSVYNKVVN